MARLNITFASLDASNTANPASTAAGLTYAANQVTVASLAAGSNNSNVFKIVHTEPVTNASIADLIAWIETNVDDYTNQLYEVYIPSIKTSDTALSPTGDADTEYSFTGTKQSDHSMIARATVTANGTDTYPVGTTLECIIKPDMTKTAWTITTSVQGIIEVSAPVSVASRGLLLAQASSRAGGRTTFTMIFNSVTFTAAGESPTHSTTDVFWVEVIRTEDRVFIRTSAAINTGEGQYFNRVYYSRMDIETEAWSSWTPYNFQIMAIDQFVENGVPDVYVQAMLNGYMLFTRDGMLFRLAKYDSTIKKAWFITDDNQRFVLNWRPGNMWFVDDLSRFNIINFGSTNDTLSGDDLAYIDVAKTFTVEDDTAVLHHYQTTTSSSGTVYNLIGTSFNNTTRYWIDVNIDTGAYTVTTQSISSGGGTEFYEITETAFNTAAGRADSYTNFITLSSDDVAHIKNGIKLIPATTTHGNTIVPFLATMNISSSPTTTLYPRNCGTISVYYNGNNMDAYEKLFILDVTNSKLWCYRNLFNYTTTNSTTNPTIKPIAFSLLNRRPDKAFIVADDVNYVPWRLEYRCTDNSDASLKHLYYSARKADGTLTYLHIRFNTSGAGTASIEKLTSLPS